MITEAETKKNKDLREAIEKALEWADYELNNGRLDNAENWLATAINLNVNYIEVGIECTIANRITNAGLRCTFAKA